MMRSQLCGGCFLFGAFLWLMVVASPVHAEFQAGAAIVDVTPIDLPVIVNGGMLTRSLDKVNTPLSARSLVLSDGKQTLAIVVVDSCMMPRPLIDEAKALAAEQVGVPANRILISATHTHSAASCMGALGTDADPNYPPYLIDKIVEAIGAAKKNLAPAEVGWGSIDAPEYTALRRWIRRPDRIAEDPFGNLTLRANMHAGRNWDDVVGESGPEDPQIGLISIRSREGSPIAVLANFSMHYFSDRDISADYFGLFSNGLKERITGKKTEETTGEAAPQFVGIMSHGCSGDIWRRDYTARNWTVDPPKAEEGHTIESFTAGMLDLAMQAYEKIEYQSDVDLAMAESRFRLNYRLPDKQRLEWAQRIVDAMESEEPKSITEVYAREQIILNELKSTEVVVQALRIGQIAIATTPNETYALTGLKLKLQSPLPNTMVIELANGGDGYIPPPEQHLLGGYNTWAARSAGLEVQAEPIIAEHALQLLEQVTKSTRQDYQQPIGPAAQAVLDAKPLAYWRLDEFAGSLATDSTDHNHDATFELPVTYFLAGREQPDYSGKEETNRSVHFAGGRLQSRFAKLGDQYSIALNFWNGIPVDARPIAGWMFSRGRSHVINAHGDHLGLAGTLNPEEAEASAEAAKTPTQADATNAGKLVYQQGNDESTRVYGKSVVDRWKWQHVVMVCDGDKVQIWLNGKLDIETTTSAKRPADLTRLFFGGRCDSVDNWEGRLDEIAVFNRALSAEEVAGLAK